MCVCTVIHAAAVSDRGRRREATGLGGTGARDEMVECGRCGCEAVVVVAQMSTTRNRSTVVPISQAYGARW